MRRFLLLPAAALATALTATGPTEGHAASCVSAAAATYRHTFDGPDGIVKITANRPLCSGQTQAFALASYTAAAPGSAAGQFIYAAAKGTVSSSRRTLTLNIAVPKCATQVYAFAGTDVTTETTDSTPVYSTTRLGSPTGTGNRSSGALAWYAGGSTACTAAPRVVFTNACDGTFTATLSNEPGATVAAVFFSGGRRVRLAAGKSTRLTATNGTTMTIRASNFTTYVGTWRSPTTGCASAAAPAGSTPVAQPAPAPPSAPTTLTPTGSMSESAGDEALTPDAESTTDPVALPTPTTVTTLTRTGMSTGSILAIVLGVLMIGGGLAALTYLIRSRRSL